MTCRCVSVREHARRAIERDQQANQQRINVSDVGWKEGVAFARWKTGP